MKDTFTIDKTFKELYKVKNDKCPICDKKFGNYIAGTIVTYEGKAYHYECYEKLKES